jgi:hypothetical protein
LYVPNASAATKAERTKAAAQLVADALRREIQGTDEERGAMLQSALEQLPDYPPALWHNGYVLNRKKWRKFDEVAELLTDDVRLAAYRRKREKTPDTVEGHLLLAAWCAKRRLTDQQRAHLTRVLHFDPDHAEARRQLGYRFIDGDWMSDQEIAQATLRSHQITVAMQRWEPTLVEIRDAFDQRSQHRRDAATERLLAIDDPSAIEPIEALLSHHNQQTALLTVEALSNMNAREASLALARQAVFSPSEEVRHRAAQDLASRDLHTFVPELLGAMGSLIQSRAELYRAPTGRLVYRHTFAREGQEQNRLSVFETEYVNASSSARSSMARAQQAHAARNAQIRENAVAQQNMAIQQFNERVCSVLANVTDEQLPASPGEWWQWWSDYNEVYTEGEKPVRGYYTRDQVAFSEYSGGNLSTFECLVAGTPVWTESGPVPIEQIKIGDRVLSKEPDTGELAYKPVLRTTERDPERLVKFQLGAESIHCSGGHPFWVSGEGWVKARHLNSGMRLHAVTGTQVVDNIEQSGFEATYNLIVADFHTYFVGEAKILSHDNTIREPTLALVPGLTER